MFTSTLTDLRVGVYDLESGEELTTLVLPPGPNDAIPLAFSPDGKYLTTQAEGVVRLWGMDRDSPETFGQELMSFSGTSAGSSAPYVGFSLDSKLLLALGADNEVKTWDIESGQELSSFICHLGANAMAISPDGEHVAVGSAEPEHETKICSLGKTFEWSTLTGHSDWLYESAFSPDGSTLCTAARDGTIKGWDLTNTGVSDYGQETLVLESDEEGNRFYDVKVSPDGLKVAEPGFDGIVRVWDAQTGEELMIFEGHDGVVLGVDYNPDGSQMASSGFDNTVRVWNIATGEQLQELTGHTDPVWDLDNSPDGALLASASADNTVRVWDTETGDEIAILENPTSMYAVAFDPTGQYLAASGNEAVIKFYDVAAIKEGTPREPRVFFGHTSLVSGLAFNPDGSLLASSCFDTLARIYNVETEQQVLTLPGHGDVVWRVTFSPDGNFLATAGRDHQARVYLLALDKLEELAESRATRPMTEAACQQYVHLDSCPG